MNARPMLAKTQVNYARMLMATKSEPDRKRAAQLLAHARSIGEKYQLRPVLSAIERLEDSDSELNLTTREIDVLKNLATGSSNGAIAQNLNISQSTVATHIRHIFRKVGVSNRTEAADFARRTGLLV